MAKVRVIAETTKIENTNRNDKIIVILRIFIMTIMMISGIMKKQKITGMNLQMIKEREACEPTLPAEYHRNWRLEEHDSNEVRMGRMTQKRFEKNMKNGKYR